ncbi:MAG: hypothetical protein AAFW70_22680 [Cyanobacteria bacterium J06635_10]
MKKTVTKHTMQLLQKSTYSQTHDLDANPVNHLETSSIEYLHMSFLLWEYKRAYSKAEYRELLQEYCWDKGSSEEKRALKLAEHYQDFACRPQALTQIPVTTLLKLCSVKYKSIIDELKQFDDQDITCDCVFKLIKQKQAQLKKEKESQLPEKPSIWKRNCRQERYVAFPPLYEDDQQTGVLTQKLMDEYGFIPQQIIRQAIADFYEKITKQQPDGSTAEDVDESRENSDEDNYSEPVVPVNQTIEEKWQQLNELLIADIDNIGEISQETGQLIFENCLSWESTVRANKKWSAIANICGRDEKLINHLCNYAYTNHSKWRTTWGEILARYDTFEQEFEWVGTVIKMDALITMGYKPTTIVEIKAGEYESMRGKIIELCERKDKPILVKFDDFQEYFHWSELEIVTGSETIAHYTTVKELTDEKYLHSPEESEIELTQNLLDKAIYTLIHGNWEEIRNTFNEHPEIKEEAWNAISAEQKRRVVDITPETVKVLLSAKKEGVIEEYKEIALGVYQIKRPGTILWEQRAFHEIEIRHYLRKWHEGMGKNN